MLTLGIKATTESTRQLNVNFGICHFDASSTAILLIVKSRGGCGKEVQLLG